MPYKDPEKRKEYHKEYMKGWLENNQDKQRGYQKKYNIKRTTDPTPKYKKQLSDVRKRRHHRNKVKVLEMYGTQCAYCGEDRYELLTCDHINNNGAEHRKSAEYKRLNLGGSYGVLSSIEYDPSEYQILCHNCNAAKQYYKITDNKGYKPLSWWKEYAKLRRKENGQKD
jgi:hypothetical protein